MRLVDSHAHLFLEEFDEDLSEVIERARRAGVSHIFMPNIDSSTTEPLWRVCTDYVGYCFPMAGLHPTSVGTDYRDELAGVERQLASGRRYVAVGEIGVDLYWDKTFRAQQLEALDCQLQWALKYGLPVVIHCREAFDEVYEALAAYRSTPLRGIWHCFEGTEEQARRVLSLPGFLLGINGVLTFKKSSLPAILPHIPLERMVLETDAPYLAPVPHRGRRNESAFVRDTAQKVADVLGLTLERVAEVTTENALSLFGLAEKPA